MGAINYGSNDYFNIGVNPENYWTEDESGENIFLDFEMEHDYNDAKSILSNYSFYYFTVTLEPGYYEGFYINIEFDYLWVDYEEKTLILKELTQLKKFLHECCAAGMVQYFAGWCMGYSDTEETKKAINQTIKDLKQDIRKYPTYKTYKAITA